MLSSQRFPATAVLLAVLVAISITARITYATGQLYPNDFITCDGDTLYSDNSVHYITCFYDPNTYFSDLVYTNGGHYGSWNSMQDQLLTVGGAGNHVSQSSDVEDGILIMQSDGNLVLYDSTFTYPYWATNSSGHSGEGPFFQIQNDGNIVVYHNTNEPLWSIF